MSKYLVGYGGTLFTLLLLDMIWLGVNLYDFR